MFESPYIRYRTGAGSGSVEGKEQLRAYWAAGLSSDPSLRFSVEDVRVAVDTVVINYRNHLGNGWRRCSASVADRSPGDAGPMPNR